MSQSTRSKLDLHTTAMSELQCKSSSQQIKSEIASQLEQATSLSTIHNIESDDDNKKEIIDQTQLSSNGSGQLEQLIQKQFVKYFGDGNGENWLLQTIKQFEQYQLSQEDQLKVIPLLLKDSAYLWYIKNEQFIGSFKMFIKLFLQQFAPDPTQLVNDISSLTSQLSLTMAREIIRTPIYFQGSKDDVLDWLEKLEQRFKMANWDDEHKLQYISIHLQGDAYKWWIQASEKIKSWSHFVDEIKQSFGSTRMKELAFEQLKWYKQSANQSITQYFDKIIELCRRIDTTMSDSMKLQYLTAGVKESLKFHIALKEPQTTEAFLLYARKLEDTLSFAGNDDETNEYDESQGVATMQQRPWISYKFQTPRKNYSQNIQYTTPRNSQGYGKNNLFNKNTLSSDTSQRKPNKQSSVICYACGTSGHYARDCVRSHFD
ncbi:unnamed protein product [Rotaria sp. Silwood2]|nr:unnamed protein product [Rotaria sp. Silwood2]